MEENEIYIQDFFGFCSFFDFNTNEEKNKDKGKFYLCSKSIVYESDNKNIPLTKFRFESMKSLPTFKSYGQQSSWTFSYFRGSERKSK